jgi:hypothetical protein
MPHEIHALVVTLMSEAEDVSTASQDWSLISKWCLMAAQKETTNRNSLVALAVNAVTEGVDKYLGRWLEQCLDTTMGPGLMTLMNGMINQGTTSTQDISQVSALMATEVGKGVALGLQSLAPLRQESNTQKGGSESGGKGYTSNDIAALMGFAGIENRGDLPEIWKIFNTTTGKNVEAYCRHIVA